ncbi:MAG: AzlD domain-containing protein [Actinomycetota bacterium]
MSWSAIVVLVAGSYGVKLVGHVVLARFAAADDARTGALRWVPDLAALIPAALFAAIIAVQTLEADTALQIDARLAGVAAAVVAVWRKAPFVVVVAAAMTVTALIRWQTGS